MKTVVIIPAYNEEKTIGEVVKEAKGYADEVIVIDDGSTDNTVNVARRTGAKVYSHSVNRGLGPSILDGYREALKRKADIVIQIDADGQYSTEEIPKLLDPILKERADMVLGSRFSGTIEEMPRTKRFGNKLFSRITSFSAGVKVSDAQTGFRAMRRELLEDVIPTGTYTYTQEMIIRAAREGYRIAEVPVHFKKRKFGKSRLISGVFPYGTRSLSIMLKTFREYRPMVFFGVPGAIMMILGFLLGIYLFYIWLQFGDIGGRTGMAVVTALLIIAGLLLVFLGMLADMMQAKYKQIREHFKRARD